MKISTIYRFRRVCNIGRDPWVNGETRVVGTVLGINFAAVRAREPITSTHSCGTVPARFWIIKVSFEVERFPA